MNDAIAAAALGALQGLTEFLPVSSSGHVAIGGSVFGLPDSPLQFTIFLHIGTLIATVLLLRTDVGQLLKATLGAARHPKQLRTTSEGRIIAGIVVATAITGVVGLSLRHIAETFMTNLHLVGWGFVVSAIAVGSTVRAQDKFGEVSIGQAAIVGLAQGVAVLPGISRSGMTIAVAMLLGVRGGEAFRFSFLASLPVIAGAAIYETLGSGGLAQLGRDAWIGGATALVTGYIALVILRRIVLLGRMWMFALYLIPLAIFLITRG